MKKERFYISTIASDDVSAARRYGLGLEIAEYCTAANMDEAFPRTDAIVREKLRGVSKRVLHAPFNELFPCAIDPKARELARFRYRQAIRLAQGYGAEKVVIHGGYCPQIYYPCWYTAQSALFWQGFLAEIPAGITVCLENVLEEEPEMLLDILESAADSRIRLCLDVGHANAYSKIPPMEWVERCAPYISHFHIHNNRGDSDSHRAVFDGTIPMAELLENAGALCPEATFTVEVTEAEPSVRCLLEANIIDAL